MLNVIKSHLFDSQTPLSKRDYAVCLFVIIAIAYAFAPQFWEPGGESLKNWVSARLFREGWGFPVFSHAPLYNLYLQFFLSFDYPLSIRLEHFVTHIFAYACVFLLLRRFIPTLLSLAVTSAWIPAIWGVEGGARVLGIGFFALYLRSDERSVFNRGYFPASLGAASLCETGYLAFLLGHMIGTFIKRRRFRETSEAHFCSLHWKSYFSVIVKSALVLLVILTILFQSKRPDNNVHGFAYPWVPCPQTEILTEAILQEGNARYITRNKPEREWMYEDWFFTNKDAFGGAEDIFHAFLFDPRLFLGGITSNVVPFSLIPLDFMVGFNFPRKPILLFMSLWILSWLLVPLCFFRLFQYFKQNNLIPHLYSIVFGVSAVMAYLSLINFRVRYVMILLPIGLLVLVHAGMNVQSLISLPRGFQSGQRWITPKLAVNSFWTEVIFLFGVLFIAMGFFTNEFILRFLLPRDAFVKLAGISFWVIDILLISTGITLIIKRHFFFSVIKQIQSWGYPSKNAWFTNVIILVMAGCVFVSSSNSHGRNDLHNSLTKNPFLLGGTMMNVHHRLLASVSKTTSVLAMEEPWIKSFADVNPDKVYHALYLPPFEDKSGNTEEFLANLDVIWVSHSWSSPVPSIPTQTYLRYKIHVEPFLEKALKKGWIEQEIYGFGKIYRKVNS